MQIKNVLILGSGGREHALANAYAKSKSVEKVFVAQGNGLVDLYDKKNVSLPTIKSLDFDAILKACKIYEIDLVDVAQDDPLANGFVDKLQEKNILAFGPTKDAAEIEWNKKYARNFMKKYNLPAPHFKSFSNTKKAIEYINNLPEQILYIKASGLAFGKGAIRGENKKKAIAAIELMKTFGKAGETFLIEECMIGEEFSLFAVCDGKNYIVVGAAQDHKTAYNKNKGLNTGGMGCVSPCTIVDKKTIQEVEKNILKPFLKGMIQEHRPYTGILYVGGMLTKKGVKIVEFNARWGDPEAQVILPSLKTDYANIVKTALEKKLNKLKIKIDNKTRISIAGCSYGYPNDYSQVKNKEIFGIKEALKLPGITIFGAGIKRKGNRFFANGGRVFHLTSEGKNLAQARFRAYGAMGMIYIEGNNLHYRTDIGFKDLERTL